MTVDPDGEMPRARVEVPPRKKEAERRGSFMRKLLFGGMLLVAVANPSTLSWVAGLYVVEDPLEAADAVVPLRGSGEEERVRLQGAVSLVRKGYAPVLLDSVDSRLFYGHEVRRLIQRYLDQQQFPEERLRFCPNRADSTREEAQALLSCLRRMNAKRVIVVTSDYHSRRARFILRNIFEGSGITVGVRPVYNQNYFDTHWWRRRRWIKTFVVESLSWLLAAAESWPLWERAPSPPSPPAQRP